MVQLSNQVCRTAKLSWVRALVLLSALTAGSVIACQVPVFRYALERWQPDRYEITVLADSKPGDDDSQLIEQLRATASEAQVTVKVVDVTDADSPALQRLWKQNSKGGQPVLVAGYPSSTPLIGGAPAHLAPLTATSIAHLTDSPVRSELAKRLTSGQSAVWIFLESGDKEKDDAAFSRLETQLALDAAWLKLPSTEELEIEPEVLDAAKIRLKIEFSVIRVPRDDPREAFLVDCLLNSESDLRGFNEPMAFPVFGRGRVLYALVGAGIASDTVRTASSFVVGPCSCQVKNQNPGFDLLLSCDWETAVGDTFISEPIPGSSGSPQLLTIPPGRAGR